MTEVQSTFTDMETASEFFKALSHPARITMMRHLYHFGPTSVQGLASKAGLKAPLASTMLRTMKANGVVKKSREGSHSFYRLTPSSRNAMAAITLILGE